MGEVVNLRLARKRKARVDREQVAERNRAVHGRTKAERERDAAEASRTVRFLDGHRRGGRDDGTPE
ncbi:MAG: DUF4169 family protein [Rhizobiaceae bacterium]|nr:MAG: DUF4169 family protein [Rhizobiaceae bacterium]CAG0996731.1 hypothetical protein RHIZO_02561 [Rhizobiaceae bacterium]